MKFHLQLTVFLMTLLFLNCSTQKSGQDSIKIAQPTNIQPYNPSFDSRKYLKVYDSLSRQMLSVYRESRGRIDNISTLKEHLLANFDVTMPPNKPLVVVYYPGLDSCNSSGFGPEASIHWHQSLAKEIKKVTSEPPLFVYKSFEGLEKHQGKIPWQKDIDALFEKWFFTYHYPCNSYVIIAPSGEYFAYYGEFSQDALIQNTKMMKKISEK